ncbi:MAG: NTP transferase domain-containing protein [Alphaproteobacteria bacterium]|nr:NTP transferase domain-containing protein [Alphaproteobacteria bacterium]
MAATQAGVKTSRIAPIILCGGIGTRLAPLSTPQKPKPFLPLIDNESLLAKTCRRVSKLGAPILIGQSAHADLIKASCEIFEPRAILLEPEAKNTAAAFALVAAFVTHICGDQGIMAVFPCDHVIEPTSAFVSSLQNAAHWAKHGDIVTIGVRPDLPDPSLGYLRLGAALAPDVFTLSAFIEKPAPMEAEILTHDPAILWNTGIYVAQAATITQAIHTQEPAITNAVAKGLAEARMEGIHWHIPAQSYKGLSAQSFDRLVMAPDPRGLVCRADFLWGDVGTQQGLTRAKNILGKSKVLA